VIVDEVFVGLQHIIGRVLAHLPAVIRNIVLTLAMAGDLVLLGPPTPLPTDGFILIRHFDVPGEIDALDLVPSLDAVGLGHPHRHLIGLARRCGVGCAHQHADGHGRDCDDCFCR
jgi:hypothetical protein